LRDVSGWRYEHKYLVPEHLLDRLRRSIEPFVALDLHASRPSHSYVVRNIYFDDAKFKSYFEKDDGIDVRAKPRIRGYDAHQPGGLVFLEVKRRHGMVGSKDRAVLRFEDLGRLFASGDVDRLVAAPAWMPESRAAARKFLFHVHRDALRPVLLECYEREPYVGIVEPSLRVTLDRRVHSALFPRLDELFADTATRRSFGRAFVLEVKHDAEFAFPFWMKTFVTRHGLIPAALSKYWTCMTDWRVVRPHSRARGHALSEWTPFRTGHEASRSYGRISKFA
jgi:VTC domain